MFSAKFKRLLLLVAATLFSLVAFAQSGSTVTMTLLDSESGEPLPFATVSLTPEGATKALKYVLSTGDGEVRITGVRKGSYTMKAELMGYKTLSQLLKVEGNVKLGKVKVDPDRQMLQAAMVSDAGNPIVVKKDTIEYNASSFKTSDNDMLIDLLKKLPGIEVDSDGSITANGQTIKKITIDGKTFFLDDPQLATQNIPSKIVEKVKVVEKKSDQALFTGIDDGEEETIIDLGIKKGMMKGWFGNIMAGGGHDVPSESNTMNDWRYQGAGFIGHFTDQHQISVILNGNNTNNRGFNDLAGSMMGNMRGGGGRGMGRSGDAGITSSWMGGVNGSWDLFDKRMELAGNYLYNNTNKYIEEDTYKQTFVSENETLDYNTGGYNNTNSGGHRVGIRLDHKFSDNTSILFEPQFNIGSGNFDEYSNFTTDRTIDGVTKNVNDGFTQNLGWNKNWTASGFGLLRQRLGKPGRTLTVMMRYNFSNNTLNGYNQSLTNVVDSLTPTIVNQRFDQNSRSSQLSGGITYTEPLWTNWYLEANYNYTWRQQTSNKDTYNSGSNVLDAAGEHLVYDASGEVRDNDYSRDILNRSHAQRVGMNIMYQNGKTRAQLGVTANPTKTYNYTNGKEYNNDVVNWAPQAHLRYEFSENGSVRLFYRGSSSQPSTSQLMPVPDNSDPLNVSLGNPQLLPYFSHNLRSEVRYTNKKTFFSINGSLDGGLTENAIINTTWYDATGAQFTFPTNGPTTGNASLRVMINTPLGTSRKFSLFSMTNLRYSNTSTYLAKGTMDMSEYFIGGDKSNFDYDKFLADWDGLREDKFDVNVTQTVRVMQRLRLTFRSDIVELTLGARTSINKGWYSVSTKNVNTTFSNQADASMNWTIPGGINLISQFNYNWYNGYTTEQQPTAILNAEITKLLFHDKVTLAVKGYDLLAQARNLSVSDTNNYHQETRNNTLGRYVVLSLTYRFGTFNKDNMRGPGGRDGGPGGGGRPPMGGGPGGPM